MRLDAAPGAVRTGQRGLLRLQFERRGERTVLAQKFASSPFGAVRAYYPDGFGRPEVQITNPSGGVLGGDHLALEISLAYGASATVLTQAASKAYRGRESVQRAEIRLEEGALLEYLPHHLIPYPGSSYRQTTSFDLAPDAALITWDAYAAGRIARDERFTFDTLHNRTTILRDGAEIAIDAFHLPGDAGHEPFGGYSYLASAYVTAPADLAPLAERVHDALVRTPGTLASASAPAPDLCVVRILTHDATALYTSLNHVRETARTFVDLPAPTRPIS